LPPFDVQSFLKFIRVFIIVNNAILGQLSLLPPVPLLLGQQVSLPSLRKYQKTLDKQSGPTPAVEQQRGNVNPTSVGV
jgi:hypothetical protein